MSSNLREIVVKYIIWKTLLKELKKFGLKINYRKRLLAKYYPFRKIRFRYGKTAKVYQLQSF